MHRKNMRWGCACAVVAALAAMAAPASAAVTPIEVHAVYSVDQGPIFGPCAGFLVLGSGTATGSPVGDASWSSSECDDLLTAPGTVSVAGDAQLAAANGDELGIKYRLSGSLGNDGHEHATGTFTVVGGGSTGAFQGASGGGSMSVDLDPVAGAATADLQGSIN